MGGFPPHFTGRDDFARASWAAGYVDRSGSGKIEMEIEIDEGVGDVMCSRRMFA